MFVKPEREKEMEISGNDSYKAIANRFVMAFVIHLALEHRNDIVSPVNQITATLGIVGATVLLYFAENYVGLIKDKGLQLWIQWLQVVLSFIQTYLAYLLIALTDNIYGSKMSDDPLSLETIGRPVILIMSISAVLVALSYIFPEQKQKTEGEILMKFSPNANESQQITMSMGGKNFIIEVTPIRS